MEGNLEIMSGIRDKLNLLLELQEDPNNPNPSLHDQPVIDKPKFAAHANPVASSGTCPATVPLGIDGVFVVLYIYFFIKNIFRPFK